MAVRNPSPWLTGIDVCLSRRRGWLTGARVGLLTHAAAVDRQGCTAAERLYRDPEIDLSALFSPEHGFFGNAGPGESCRSRRHPSWNIPIYSLYGSRRKPSRRMLAGVDVLLVDLQDLAARPYTYVSTLWYVLEAAADTGKPLVVADRPAPLPRVVDGPPLDPAFRSFVALIDAPLSYGMTPAETARWIVATEKLDVDLRVAPMRGYGRDAGRGAGWPPWIPPSPAIRSWESAMCFPALVWMEAFPVLDHGRSTNLAFQVFGMREMNGEAVAEALAELGLPGVRFYSHRYVAAPPGRKGPPLDGCRLVVTDPHRFKPARTGVAILHTLNRLYGQRLWRSKGVRPEFLDRLMGTDAVRRAVRDGQAVDEIVERWRPGLRRFRRRRRDCLLYPER